MNFKKLIAFRKKLPQVGDYLIKDVIDLILSEKLSAESAYKYLNDSLELIKVQYAFHMRWKRITNMRNVAAYEKRDIATFKKVIKLVR